jgi:cyclic pyranopterin phosphate synthase
MPFGGGSPVSVAEMQGLLVAQGVLLAPDAIRGWGPARHRMEEEPLRSMVRIGG